MMSMSKAVLLSLLLSVLLLLGSAQADVTQRYCALPGVACSETYTIPSGVVSLDVFRRAATGLNQQFTIAVTSGDEIAISDQDDDNWSLSLGGNVVIAAVAGSISQTAAVSLSSGDTSPNAEIGEWVLEHFDQCEPPTALSKTLSVRLINTSGLKNIGGRFVLQLTVELPAFYSDVALSFNHKGLFGANPLLSLTAQPDQCLGDATLPAVTWNKVQVPDLTRTEVPNSCLATYTIEVEYAKYCSFVVDETDPAAFVFSGTIYIAASTSLLGRPLTDKQEIITPLNWRKTLVTTVTVTTDLTVINPDLCTAVPNTCGDTHTCNTGIGSLPRVCGTGYQHVCRSNGTGGFTSICASSFSPLLAGDIHPSTDAYTGANIALYEDQCVSITSPNRCDCSAHGYAEVPTGDACGPDITPPLWGNCPAGATTIRVAASTLVAGSQPITNYFGATVGGTTNPAALFVFDNSLELLGITGALSASWGGSAYTTTFLQQILLDLTSTSITLIVTDTTGLSAACAITITVIDDIAPVLTCPANLTGQTVVAFTNNFASVAALLPAVTDNSGETLTAATVTDFAVNPAQGAVTIRYTAQDSAGNTGECSFLVYFDNVAPTLAQCPIAEDIGTLGLDSAYDAFGTLTYTTPTAAHESTDACAADRIAAGTCIKSSLLFYSMANAAIAAPGSPSQQAVTSGTSQLGYFRVSDSLGNVSAKCFFTLKVSDDQDPQSACDQSAITATIPTLAGENYAVLGDISAALGASDNVAVTGASMTLGDYPITVGGVLALGANLIFYNIGDAAGNSDSCSLTVTVVDQEAPVTGICPANFATSVGASATWLAASASFPLPSYTDNVSAAGAIVTTMVLTNSGGATIAVGTQLAPGVYTATFTAADAVGNTQSDCAYSVTVGDTTPPTIANCQNGAAVTHATEAGKNYWTPSSDAQHWLNLLSAADNVLLSSDLINGQTLSAFLSTQLLVSAGVVSYNYTATDSSGLTSQCQFTVQVLDLEPAVIDCSAVIPANALSSLPYGEGQRFTVAHGFDFAAFAQLATATDNVDVTVTAVAVTPTQEAIGDHGLLRYTYRFTAQDAALNAIQSCQIQIESVDNAPAVVDCSKIPGLPLAFTTGTGSNGYVGDFSALTLAVLQAAGAATDNLKLKSVGIFNSLGNDANGFKFEKTANTAAPTTHTLTLSVIDHYNTPATTCTFTITVQDNEKPVTACPANKQASITNSDTVGQNTWGDLTQFNALIGGAIAWTDNVDASGVGIAVVYDLALPLPLGVTTITSTATDASGNTDTCTFQVTILDAQKPSGQCPENYPNAVSAAGTDVFSAAWQPPLLPPFVDNSGFRTVTITDTYTLVGEAEATAVILYGAALGSGHHQIFISVKDAALNEHTCSYSVDVDVEGPSIQCPDSSTQYITAGATVSYTLPQPPTGTVNANPFSPLGDILPSLALCLVNAGTGACDVQSTTANLGVGTYTLRWSASDAAYRNVGDPAKSNTCEFTVIVQDKVAPVITACGAPSSSLSLQGSTYTVGITAPSNTYSGGWGAAVATDNLPGPIAYTFSATGGVLQATALAIGTYTITYKATDQYDNESIACSFTIVVVDNIAPVTACTYVNLALPASGEVGDDLGKPYYTGAFATILGQTDNVGITALTLTYNGVAADGYQFLSGAPSGQDYTLTLTATDAYGNVDTCQLTFTVRDLEDPSSNYNGALVSTATALPAVSTDSVAEPCTESKSTYTGAWFATSDALTTADNVEVASTAIAVSHNGGTFITALINSPLAQGDNVIRFTITDTSNNSIQRYVSIAVADTVAPVLGCPADMTLTLPSANSATAVTATATAGGQTLIGAFCDNVDANSGLSPVNSQYTNAFGFSLGSATVNYAASDAASNAGLSCSTEVTIIDTTPPTITLKPEDIIVNCSTGDCVNGARQVTFVYTVENNGPSTVTVTNAQGEVVTSDGTFFPIGLTTLTITASDATFNNATATTHQFTIAVYDNIAPIVECPASQTLPVSYKQSVGDQFNVVTHASVGSDFNCGESISNTAAVVGAPAQNPHQLPLGAHTIVYTVSQTVDNCGIYTRPLSNTCQFTITITDAVNPVPDACSAAVTIDSSTNNGNAYQHTPTTFTDNHYQSLTVARLTPAGTAAIELAPGANTVTYQATDGSGNVGVCTTIVTYQDDSVPVIACPVNAVLPMDAGLTTATSAFQISATPFDYDGSGNNNITSIRVGSDASLPITGPSATGAYSATLNGPWTAGLTTIVMIAADANGRTATCSFTITVEDKQEPTQVTCPANIAIRASNTALPDLIILSSLTAATGAGSLTLSGASFDASEAITWSFTDNFSAVAAIVVTFEIPDLENNQLAVGDHDVFVIATDAAGNQYSSASASACKFVLTVLPTYDTLPTARDVFLSKVFIQQLSTADASVKYGAYLELKTNVPWPHKLRKVEGAALLPGNLELFEVIGTGCTRPANQLGVQNQDTAAECRQTFAAVVDLPPGCAPVSQVYSFQVLSKCDNLNGDDDCTQNDSDWIIDVTLRADNYCSAELADVSLTAVLVTLADSQMLGFADAQALALPTPPTVFYNGDTVNGVLVVSSPDVELTSCTLIDVRRLPQSGGPEVLFTTEVFGSPADETSANFVRDTAEHVFWTKFTFPVAVGIGQTESATLSGTVALEYNLGGARRRRLMTIKMMVSADGSIAQGSRQLMQAAAGTSGSGDAVANAKYVAINNPFNVDSVTANARGLYSFVIARMVMATTPTEDQAAAYVEKIEESLNSRLSPGQRVSVSVVRVDDNAIIVSIGHDGTLSAILRNHITDATSSFNTQLTGNVGAPMDPQFFYEGEISPDNTAGGPNGGGDDSLLPILLGAVGAGSVCCCIIFFLLCKRREEKEEEREETALEAKNRETGVPMVPGVMSSRRFSFSNHSSVAPGDVLVSGEGGDQHSQRGEPEEAADNAAATIHRRLSWTEDAKDNCVAAEVSGPNTFSSSSSTTCVEVLDMLQSPPRSALQSPR